MEAVEPTGGRVLETATASLAYDEQGTGEAVVLLHSGLVDRQMWDPQLRALASRFRTVRYDLQGYGRSSATAPGTNREECLAVLDGLDIDQCHLVGASFGAEVALDVALGHPDRVRSLALLGPVIGGHDYEEESEEWERTVATYEASVAAFERGDLERAADLEVELWVVGAGRTAAEVDGSVREFVHRLDLEALRNDAGGRQRPDASDLEPPAIDRLRDLSVPMLAVVGEHDLPHVQDAVRRLVQEVPDARQVVIEAAGHLPSLEQPVEVTTALLAFLDGTSDRPEGTA